jgi:3-phenylpropionate/cinnamic acid dioxygenase small subunit
MLSLQEISDRLEIQDLFVRYSHAVDTKDWDLYRTVFTEDAYIDYSEMGGSKGDLEETVAFLASAMPMFASTQHLVANTVLTLDGDTASTRTICFNPMVMEMDGAERVFFCGLWYRDELVRTPDGWKIKHRYEERSYTYNRPEGLGVPAE